MSKTINVSEIFKTAEEEGNISKVAIQSLKLGDITQAINANMGISANDVQASEVILLSIVIDDSGSIRFAGNAQPIRDGYNSLLDSLLKSKQKDSILAMCKYLNGLLLYPFKPLDQVVLLDTSNYDPNGGTPLYDVMQEILGTTIAKVQEFANNGVPARAITLVLTDGADSGSRTAKASDIQIIVKDMLRTETHIVAGYGVEDPGGPVDFHQVFASMGIADAWILTSQSDPSSIRKAFAVLSQSIVRASQSSATFSQQQLGGFGG